MEVSDISTKRIESTQSIGKPNEEENYAQLSLLLTRISPCAVRSYFDCKFAPACLDTSLTEEYNKLLDLKKKHIINQSEWFLLFPSYPDTPSSETFDMSLLITLLRNLTPMTPPLNGFDRLPCAMETTPAADLARIRFYRNYLAHLDYGKIDITFFNTAWKDITSAIERLGGQQMKLECDYIKSKPLDPTKQEIMMDIKHSHNEIWKLKQSLASLKHSRTEMKISHELVQEIHAVVTKEIEEIEEMKNSQMDYIPLNIRVQHRQEISEWMQEKATFVETRATRHILESLPSHNCIVVTGSSGCGTSSNIHHAALHLRDSFGYEIIPVLTVPTDIINYYNVNKKQVFIVDDICGKETINMQTLQTWRDYSEKMEKIFKIAKKDIASKIDYMVSTPLISIKQNIHNIITENKEQVCALVLCILFDGGFDTSRLTLRSNSEKNNKKIEDILNEFDIDLSKEKHRDTLKNGFRTLDGTYLKLRDTQYSVIHDTIHKMAAVICGQHLTECFIKYAPSVFIRDHFIFESLTEVHENDDLIVLDKDLEKYYFQRLLGDLKESVVTSTFHNYQLIYQPFIDKLIRFFEENDDAKTLLKEFDTIGCNIPNVVDGLYEWFETQNYTTPLIESALKCYFDIVQFLIANANCNVNQTDGQASSPLYKASKGGHLNVVKLLLEKNAEINQCNNICESPLYVACEGGYTDIAEQLLQNKANVSQYEKQGGQSPLHAACDIGPLESDSYKIRYESNIKTVELLLAWNADPRKFNKRDQTPLDIARKSQCMEIVKLLEENILQKLSNLQLWSNRGSL